MCSVDKGPLNGIEPIVSTGAESDQVQGRQSQKVPRDQKLKSYFNCISNIDRIPRGGEENNSWLSIQHLLVQNVGYPALGGGSGSSKNRELIKGKKNHRRHWQRQQGGGDSLRDERRGDRVLHQNRQGDHLAELHGRGVGRSAEGLVHGEPPGAPGHLLQELRLRGHGCRQGRERGGGTGER